MRHKALTFSHLLFSSSCDLVNGDNCVRFLALCAPGLLVDVYMRPLLNDHLDAFSKRYFNTEHFCNQHLLSIFIYLIVLFCNLLFSSSRTNAIGSSIRSTKMLRHNQILSSYTARRCLYPCWKWFAILHQMLRVFQRLVWFAYLQCYKITISPGRAVFIGVLSKIDWFLLWILYVNALIHCDLNLKFAKRDRGLLWKKTHPFHCLIHFYRYLAFSNSSSHLIVDQSMTPSE